MLKRRQIFRARMTHHIVVTTRPRHAKRRTQTKEFSEKTFELEGATCDDIK